MRVLLIDDDRDFVEATRTVLDSVPYHVDVAYNGRAGLAQARAARPDLIILDIVMPGESGFDIYDELQAESGLADIPVIMLTSLSSGLGTPTVAKRNVDYIEKPIRPTELLKKIKSLIR